MIKLLDDISIDPGASSPRIICSDDILFILFYTKEEITEDHIEPKGRNTFQQSQISIIRFDHYFSHKYGLPNDETFHHHTLYSKGLKFYRGQYARDSHWLKETIKTMSSHPYFDKSSIEGLKHYIFSFKEGTFECLATGYEIAIKEGILFDLSLDSLKEIFVGEVGNLELDK